MRTSSSGRGPPPHPLFLQLLLSARDVRLVAVDLAGHRADVDEPRVEVRPALPQLRLQLVLAPSLALRLIALHLDLLLQLRDARQGQGEY